MSNKRAKIICKNRSCQEFLCESDGCYLYVENLEIRPKMGRRTKNGWNPLFCPKCESITRIYLEKELPAEKEKTGRKFSIFRSRF